MEYTLDDIRHNLEVMANRIDQLGWTIEVEEFHSSVSIETHAGVRFDVSLDIDTYEWVAIGYFGVDPTCNAPLFEEEYVDESLGGIYNTLKEKHYIVLQDRPMEDPPFEVYERGTCVSCKRYFDPIDGLPVCHVCYCTLILVNGVNSNE